MTKLQVAPVKIPAIVYHQVLSDGMPVRTRAAGEVEDKAMMEQAGSPANAEAIRAFIEKRKPDFKKLRPQS